MFLIRPPAQRQGDGKPDNCRRRGVAASTRTPDSCHSAPVGLSGGAFTLPRAARRARRRYQWAAPRYGFYRHLWLAFAGSAAEQALLDDLAATLRPGQRVLDAGCGTGAVSREILRLCPGVHLAMLDLCAAMLAGAAGTGAPRVLSSVGALPFPDDTFDVVVSAWVIEHRRRWSCTGR